MKIRNKIAVATGACLLTAVLALLAITAWQNNKVQESTFQQVSNELEEAALQRLQAMAEAQARRTQSEFNDTLITVEGLTQTISSFAGQDPRSLSRDAYSDYIRSLLLANPDMAGLYTAWLENAVDGRDAMYEGGDYDHSHFSGRFSPFWFRNSDGSLGIRSLNVTPFVTGEGLNPSRDYWYDCPINTQRTCLTEPYTWEAAGETILGTSITMPLKINGELAGMTGADLELTFLSDIARQASADLYDGRGRVLLFTTEGKVAADSERAYELGADYTGSLRSRVLDLIQQKKTEVFQHEDRFVVVTPVELPNVRNAWGIAISIDQSIVLAGAQATQDSMATAFAQGLAMQLTLGLVILVVSIVILAFIARNIAAPIIKAANMVHQLASQDGDLTQRLNLDRKDEIGDLSKGIDAFLTKTHGIVKDIANEMKEVEASAVRAASISDQSTQGIEKQRAEMDQVATAINEMSASAGEVAEIATTTANSSNEAKEGVESGSNNVQKSAHSIRTLSEQLSHTRQLMTELAQDSENIIQIVEVIQGISEQTNLLALNAAIEAARAGEAGRGFAVVADEVRSLASKTQDSTQEIQSLIDQLQRRSSSALKAMEQGDEQSNECLSLADDASANLLQVVNSITEIDNMTTQMASVVEEQRAVTEDITRSIIHINDENSLVAEGSMNANQESQTLLTLVKKLETELGRFRF